MVQGRVCFESDSGRTIEVVKRTGIFFPGMVFNKKANDCVVGNLVDKFNLKKCEDIHV